MKILIRGTYFDDTLLSTLLSTGLPYHLKKFLFMPRSTCYFLREYNQTIMLLKMWHISNIFSAAMCSNIWKFWFHKIYIIYIQGEKTYWIDWWSYLYSVNHCLDPLTLDIMKWNILYDGATMTPNEFSWSSEGYNQGHIWQLSTFHFETECMLTIWLYHLKMNFNHSTFNLVFKSRL